VLISSFEDATIDGALSTTLCFLAICCYLSISYFYIYNFIAASASALAFLSFTCLYIFLYLACSYSNLTFSFML